ncbi:MAG: hypothetical protein GY803_30105 [Chloroflexi bacterium]|nr:hypothetical protein [Chloroflexota bacterium]
MIKKMKPKLRLPVFIRITVVFLFFLIVVTSFPVDTACAQGGLCIKNVTTSFTLDGVVAPGTTTGACSTDPVWSTVNPAQFQPVSSPDGFLYLAHYDPNPGDSHLLIGVDVQGDEDLSDFDVVSLYFDANNNDAWDADVDFAIQVEVSNSSTGITSGDDCNQATGDVTYFNRTASGWLPVAVASAEIDAENAYDYDSVADPETDLWNLEIDIPISFSSGGDTYFDLDIAAAPYFGVGGYLYLDDGHQQSPQVGTVLTWPTMLESALTMEAPGIEMTDPTFAAPAAGDLVDISLEDVCFDVNFTAPDPWVINGNPAQSGDYRVNRSGNNTFRSTFYFDGPGVDPMSVANPGTVRLGLKPYGPTSGTTWEQTEMIDATPYNFNQARAVEFTYDFSNPPASFGDPDMLNFVCATTTLEDFTLDDNVGNNGHNVNYNYFTTSEYTQSFWLFGDSVPGLNPGESATIFLKMDTTNELPELDVPPTGRDSNLLDKIWSIITQGNLATRIWLILFVIGLIILLLIALILWRRAQSAVMAAPATTRRNMIITGILALILFIAGLLGLLPDLQRDQVIGTERWSITNAGELGLISVEDRPGWFQMEIAYGDVIEAELQFDGQRLPYETTQARLEPVVNGEPNFLEVPVEPGGVVSLIAFGEVDLDGDGPLAPTSASGFVQEATHGEEGGYLLREGYYMPNEFSGALIGSFDGGETSFVVGRNSSILVPEEVDSLMLAVNAPLTAYEAITGIYDLNIIETPPPGVPTHSANRGDATYQIPITFLMWDVLTSVDIYTFYMTENIVDNELVGQTMHPWNGAHFSIYDSHIDIGDDFNENDF